MSKYFGTDGFRGEANIDLTVEHAMKIGLFLGHYYGKERKARVVIGKDTRLSSYMFEDALSAGLTAAGADAYLMHVTTTPSVSYVARTEGFDCGIMISASHNPYYDNGIKLLNGNGEKMEDEVILACESYLDGVYGPIPYAKREAIGKTVDYFAGRNRYIGYLISLARNSYKGRRVGLDCANGSAWMIAKSVFDALGATTFAINCDPDGTNINRNAGSTHIEHLQQYVLNNKLDVGFAFDGDADRLIASDERGQIINGDQVMALLAVHMKEKGTLRGNTLVATVMSNMGLELAMKKRGVKLEKTKVGDRYVLEKMLADGYNLGGEQSGHVIMLDYNTTGDGLITAVQVISAMAVSHTPLSRLAGVMQNMPQSQFAAHVNDAHKYEFDQHPKIKARIAELELKYKDMGRLVIRASGTEPLVRVMIEGPDQRELDKDVFGLAKLIEKELT